MAVENKVKSGLSRRKSSQTVKFCVKEERNASYKKVSAILQKQESERTEEEKEMLLSCSELVKEVTRRIEKREKVKERLKEVEDPPDVLKEKCVALAKALMDSKHLVVYTGAGVSTAAHIPDYRGTNGIWTLLQKGKDIGLHDLTQAEPTLTHMSLWQLYKVGVLKHVVSQNCDGLHLRSGLPRTALSEVHGNMYIEVCSKCKPGRVYWRLFDVTEHTARFNHRTMRRCYNCMGSLVDTIVHFGERGTLCWPLNWRAACEAADKADVILCIGSSLKVLKKYPWLWGMDKPAKKRPKLYIVNLQWTPKDDQAVLKINGKCDEIMQQVMSLMELEIPSYNRDHDPIFSHATTLHPAEVHTATQPLLKLPDTKSCVKCSISKCSCKISQACASSKAANTTNKIGKKSIDVKKTCDANSGFHFVNIKSDCALDSNFDEQLEDPFGKLEVGTKQPCCDSFASTETKTSVKCETSNCDIKGIVPVSLHSLLEIEHNYCACNSATHTLISTKSKNTSSIATKDKDKNSPKSSNSEGIEPSDCPFCKSNYNSEACQFYPRRTSVFIAKPKNSKQIQVCECCDSEDEDSECTGEKSEEDVSKTAAKVPNVNPGWYGKGYRKRTKRKRVEKL